MFIALLMLFSFGENFELVEGNGRTPYDSKDNAISSEMLEQLYDAIARNEIVPESQSDETYDTEDSYNKRGMPFSGGIYGKRAIPFSGGVYGKRGNVPFSGGFYGKRAVPFSGGVYGKKSVPFSGGFYGKRASAPTHTGGKKSIPFSGGLYG